MQAIDESRLETDLEYRYEYLAEFMGFGEEEAAVVHESATLLSPLIPGLVDGVYEKLHAYDCTWRHFLPRHHGFEGEVPAALEELPLDHPQIEYRKQHLARYLERLVTASYDGRMAGYLHVVGSIHTSHAGNAQIAVPLVQMNALLGYVADAITAALLNAELPEEKKTAMIRAFTKLLWLQSDFITRHYLA